MSQGIEQVMMVLLYLLIPKEGYSRLRSMIRHCSLKARALLKQCMVVSPHKNSKSIDAWRMEIRLVVTKLRHTT